MGHPPHAGVARFNDFARPDRLDAHGNLALPQELAQPVVFAGRKRQAVEIDTAASAVACEFLEQCCDFHQQRVQAADGIFLGALDADRNVLQIHARHSSINCRARLQACGMAAATEAEGSSPQSTSWG